MINKDLSVINLIATSLNRKDEKPNEDLAMEIIRSKRVDWIKELVENLENRDTNIQNDCIKVLYEIGEHGAAGLIAPYCSVFGDILQSKNNRLVWGAMTALDSIAMIAHKEIFGILPLVISTINKGSVITKDHGVGILAKLSSFSDYSNTVFPLLLEQLKTCPSKHLPMYAEKSMIAINSTNKDLFIKLIQARLPEMEKNSQRQRINKVVRSIEKKV